MKNILLSLLFSFSFLTMLNANENEDPIVVRLSNENVLYPLYLVHFIDETAGFDSGYLQRLEGVLRNDLDFNGYTTCLDSSKNQDQIALKGSFENLGDVNLWKTRNIRFVVKARIKNRSLRAIVLDTTANLMKTTDEIVLSGDPRVDQKQIHSLADTILKTLFGVDGIATTHILYTNKRRIEEEGGSSKWVSEVWEIDYDGMNARQITHENNYIVTPTYVPPKAGFTAGSFFYVSYQLGQPKIYGASLQDGRGRRLTTLSGNQLMPAISPQRNQIAFVCDVAGNPDLFLLNFDPQKGAIDKPRQIFSAKKAVQGTPSFSPDGKQIAFVSNKDGSTRIYVMDIPAEGTNLKDIKPLLITKANRESSAPSWSPDGKKIAYCALTNNVRQIWVYDIETKKEKQLTQGSGNKENPSWAPNSLHLVFNSTNKDDCELFLINLNQSESKKITKGNGEKHFPSWEPRSL